MCTSVIYNIGDVRKERVCDFVFKVEGGRINIALD